MPVSESGVLTSQVRALVGVKRDLEKIGLHNKAADIAQVIHMLAMLSSQAEKGIHRNPHRRNPALVVYNPPDLQVRRSRAATGRIVGQIASNVHEIKYEHAEDGKLYVHPFAPGVRMFALAGKEILLAGDNPLWGEF